MHSRYAGKNTGSTAMPTTKYTHQEFLLTMERDGLSALPWLSKRHRVKSILEACRNSAELCDCPTVHRIVSALAGDEKWEVRLEVARFTRFLPMDLGVALENQLAADKNRSVADAARKIQRERKKVHHDANRVTEFFLSRTAQTRETVTGEEKITLADTLTTLMREGVSVLTPPGTGISLFRAAMFLNEDHEDAAHDTVKRWRNNRAAQKPPVIGKGQHGRELYRCEDLIRYIETADPGAIRDRSEFHAHLREVVEKPLPE